MNLPYQFLAAGGVEIPFLRNITQVLGITANSLQKISTQGINTPYTVFIVVGGLGQFWTLQIGSDATDLPNGIAQAGDYAITGNIWYRTAMT